MNDSSIDDTAPAPARLGQIRIVMVGTTLPGNIGSAARAMKVMGLSDLVLVSPKIFPHADASARASGADDVLARTCVVDSLAEAIADCRWVVGTSARSRSLTLPVVDARETGLASWQRSANGTVAIVFGRENSGLTNEELEQCQALLHIPVNPAYSSLNVAAAIQVVAYEIRMAAMHTGEAEAPTTRDAIDGEWASQERIEGYFAHLEQVLIQIGFLNPAQPRYLMRRLRRLYSRSGLAEDEVNILRGIVSQTEKKLTAPRTNATSPENDA